jgi:tetratricopeptide (TPR) repeat protein
MDDPSRGTSFPGISVRRPVVGLLLAVLFLSAAGCAGAPGRKAPPVEPKAVEDRRLPPALVKSGNINFSQGRYEEAVADFTKAIERWGGEALTYNTRGRVYFEMGRYEEALADCSRAAELDPRSDVAWNTRGYILYTRHRYEEALRDLDRALEINPRHEGARNHRGLVHAAMDRYELAQADFDEALKLDPDYNEVYANKAEAYERKGSKDEALSAYREYLRRATSPRESRRVERAKERIRILTAQ